ncbi:MAG: hypothetical protein KAJ40_00545 [Alphaproteobacteria bacterium]|nr:hypothetical protein [Alphaproteobacteria bacterium]
MTDIIEENPKHDDIPEKFKNPETGELQLDLLIKSYRELEQRLSENKMPQRPKTPEEYPINCDHGMFQSDVEINRRLYENDFSPNQAQIVYDLAAERMMPMLRDVVSEFRAEREVEKLVNHFGGSEQWRGLSHQLLNFGKQNLPPDVLDSLSSSYEGVLALYRMMKAGGEPKLASRKSAHAQGGLNETELSSMMRDPKYWRDKDPAYVAKVTQGFESLYGQ